MGDEERRQALLGERVDGVQRLRRRARLERDEVARPVEPEQRVGESVAEPRIPAAIRSAASSRFGESSRWTKAAAIGPSTASSARSNQPPIRDRSTSTTASMTAEVCVEHVAAADVRELVREHRLELGRRQRAEQSGRTERSRTRRTAAGRERTRKAVGDQIELRRRRCGTSPRARRRSSAAADPRRARTRGRRASRAARGRRTRRRRARRAGCRRRRPRPCAARRAPSRTRRQAPRASRRAATTSRG